MSTLVTFHLPGLFKNYFLSKYETMSKLNQRKMTKNCFTIQNRPGSQTGVHAA